MKTRYGCSVIIPNVGDVKPDGSVKAIRADDNKERTYFIRDFRPEDQDDKDWLSAAYSMMDDLGAIV